MRAVTAAIYSRTSHDPKGRQAGVARQESDCHRMAEDRDWLVLEPVYRKNDASASTRSEKRRQVFEQLMQDVAGRPGPRSGSVPRCADEHGSNLERCISGTRGSCSSADSHRAPSSVANTMTFDRYPPRARTYWPPQVMSRSSGLSVGQ